MNIIALDTETTVDDAPWSVQVCDGDTAIFVEADNPDKIGHVCWLLRQPDTLTVVHNALFDLDVLNKLHIHPHKVADTQVMAYLLGEASQSLKVLAYRELNIEMDDYMTITNGARQHKAWNYLSNALWYKWADPKPVEEHNADGSVHVKHPQNIAKKIERLMTKYVASPTGEVDLYKTWHRKEWREQIVQVEEALGVMPNAYLSDIDRDTAIQYAKDDAKATHALYAPLWERVCRQGLERAFWIDMGAVPVVVDMMNNGITVDVGCLQRLEQSYIVRREELGQEIRGLAGRYINPGSSKQVAEALFEAGLREDPGGSTSADVLAGLSMQHRLPSAVREYRGVSKLIDTYTEPLRRRGEATGRIHTTFTTTFTETGRLSSREPNLQNIPPGLREAFVAERG